MSLTRFLRTRKAISRTFAWYGALTSWKLHNRLLADSHARNIRLVDFGDDVKFVEIRNVGHTVGTDALAGARVDLDNNAVDRRGRHRLRQLRLFELQIGLALLNARRRNVDIRLGLFQA